jgi:hypothetical protein
MFDIYFFCAQELRTNLKIVLTIKNYSDQILKYIILMKHRNSGFLLFWSHIINKDARTEYAVVRIAGVIVYHIKNYNLSLAFMWSVPLNYLFYSNILEFMKV